MREVIYFICSTFSERYFKKHTLYEPELIILTFLATCKRTGKEKPKPRQAKACYKANARIADGNSILALLHQLYVFN